MSDISEKIRKAIFAKSNVAALVGSGKLTGIYNGKATKTAVFPFGIFNYSAPGNVEWGFNAPARLYETGLWQFKVVTDSDTIHAGKEPQEFAAEYARLWETTLGHTLTLTGASVIWMARFADIPEYEEQQGDRYIYHRGFQMRITAK